MAALQGLLASSQTFGSDLVDCGGRGYSLSREECNWATIRMSRGEREQTFENFGLEENGVSLRGGAQRELNEVWRGGFALGVDSIDQRSQEQTGVRATTKGEGVSLGLSLGRDLGEQSMLDLSLAGGWHEFETERSVNVFEPGYAEARSQAGYIDARARIGALFGGERFGLEPYAELAATTLIHSGFAEFGKDGIGLASEGETQTVFSAAPGLALQANFGDAEAGRLGRLRIDFGGRFYSEDHVGLPISFVYAPQGAEPADITTEIDEQLYRAGASFELIGADNLNVKFDYEHEWGDNTDRHQAGIRVGYRF